MDEYGFIIRRSLITDITPDAKVEAATNSLNAAKRNKKAAARGGRRENQASRRREGRSRKQTPQGEGTANQRKAIAQGIADSARIPREADVSEKEVNAILLATQFFDMRQSLGQHSKNTTIFLPASATAGNQILAELTAALTAAEKNGSGAGD